MIVEKYHIYPAIVLIRAQLPNEAAKISGDYSFQDLNEDQINQLIQFRRERGLKLHRFNKTIGLPRVSKVIGYLHAFYPQTLLDIGTDEVCYCGPLWRHFPAPK